MYQELIKDHLEVKDLSESFKKASVKGYKSKEENKDGPTKVLIKEINQKIIIKKEKPDSQEKDQEIIDDQMNTIEIKTNNIEEEDMTIVVKIIIDQTIPVTIHISKEDITIVIIIKGDIRINNITTIRTKISIRIQIQIKININNKIILIIKDKTIICSNSIKIKIDMEIIIVGMVHMEEVITELISENIKKTY